ncbi:glycosyltransferase [Salirhabdus salicampi]|uniref:glycosyltransferase n=1 Tax=Salirhabdus salicampi TaxID=476102 RepID=UPI0020C4A33E|nr:glycosyltransferase [Salirhabdus salicampi]MCP8617489.1 glycosyltransferase [Salirhabdus salicampi]
MKGKRILVITNMYPSKKHHTFGIFVKNQVESLRKRGYVVDVLAVKDPRMGKIFVMKKYGTWLIRFCAIFLLKGRKYDIVHAHYIFPSGWLGQAFKRWFGAKLIITAHGGDVDKMMKKGSIIQHHMQRILHACDHIVAVGPKLKADIVEHFRISEKKVEIINMGVNRKQFHPLPKRETKEKLGISKEKFIILYAGNFIRAKGLEELILAYHRLKQKYDDIELHIIGAIKEPHFFDDMKQTIHRDHIQDVTIHGPKEQSTVAKWIAAANMFVLPSYMEGFGLVALEAMSCHTPVVGSQVGGLAHLLQDGAGILVKPKDVSSLQAGMERLLQDEQLNKRLIDKGEMIAQQNDQDRLVNELISLYAT